MNKDDLIKRTKEFVHRCVKLAVSLPNTYLGNHVKGQLIRCSTSVASNYRAACHAISRAAFVSKLSIVIEEADESEYWLEFIIDEQLKPKNQVQPLKNEANELASIFVTSRRTIQSKKNRKSPIINHKSKLASIFVKSRKTIQVKNKSQIVNRKS
jgi:four helix bundle protein